ncbi:MAG: EamA family transporter, partial [Roseiflexaceae bacterium]
MVRLDRTRRSAALLAGLVASIIWSTSFLVTNAWLPGMGPLTIAGLRSTVAGVLLLPLVVRVRRGSTAAALPWARLSLIGVSAYTIGNVAVFAALATLS